MICGSEIKKVERIDFDTLHLLYCYIIAVIGSPRRFVDKKALRKQIACAVLVNRCVGYTNIREGNGVYVKRNFEVGLAVVEVENELYTIIVDVCGNQECINQGLLVIFVFNIAVFK